MLMFDVSRYKNGDKKISLSGQWGDRSQIIRIRGDYYDDEFRTL